MNTKMLIGKDNIKKAIIDLEGSSYIRFETNLDLKNETLGDFYWQGDKKFFEINISDLLSNRNETDFEEGDNLQEYLTEEAIDYIIDLANDELYSFI